MGKKFKVVDGQSAYLDKKKDVKKEDDQPKDEPKKSAPKKERG